jgi:LPXTG-motif cell wall-anchored protein
MQRSFGTAMVIGTALAFGLLVCPPAAVAQTVVAPTSSASDSRATFVTGNVVTCAGAGIVSTPGVTIIQVGADGNASASDPNVSGTVQAHSGGGEELNVAITGANVVIDGVIVKGGPAFNRYTNPVFLPPTLPPPQGYISPFNTGGNIPAISHWFICYHVTAPLPTGSLQITKSVVLPDGVPVTPLPTLFRAQITCDDEDPAHNGVVTFGNGGGRSLEPVLTGIPVGTTCTVVEITGNAPVVTYTPVGADSPGVVITQGEGVTVDITNDFSSVPVQRGSVRVVKALATLPPGVTPPASFTVHVACNDGTAGSITLPGGGGVGTPDISVRSESLCALIEDVSTLPPGWSLVYSVNGGPVQSAPPLIPILDASTVTITITNTFQVPPTTTTTTTTTTTIASTTTTAAGGGDDELPDTGQSPNRGGLLALLLIAVGGAALLLTRRPRSTS